MKMGNLEVPDHVSVIISFPDADMELLKKITSDFSNSTIFAINRKLKVIAQNEHLIVLEVQL